MGIWILERGDILGSGDIFSNEMKVRTEKEYLEERAALQPKLLGGNVIKAINTWAVATVIMGALMIR